MNTLNILHLAVLACLFGVGAAVHAADDGVKKAVALLDKHYYESAAAGLRGVASSGEFAPVAALSLARAYARNAELHRALQRSSLLIGVQYLKKLATQSGRERSLFVPLYYGEYLSEAGKPREGAEQLRRYVEQKDALPVYRDIARLSLARAQNAAAPAMRSSDSLVRSQQAVALSLLPARRAEAVSQIDQAIAELTKTQAPLPVRALTNAIAVYTRNGQSEKAIVLLSNADLGRPSVEETISQSKVLRFYDPALLGNLAALYQSEAERLLQRVRGDPRYKSVAGYFLADLYLGDAQWSKAGALLVELAGASDLPAPYRERLALMQATFDVGSGQAARGQAAFDELGRKHAQDPVLLAEVLGHCVRLHATCAGVTASARALAQANQGERFRSLHFAVGEQYAAEGQAERALLSMETARDKSNKNRIDTNDPVLLVRLADLYFGGKSFSESLEIYFELSKEYPAVRQLQETGQGVYSTEYRSAGDVKIF